MAATAPGFKTPTIAFINQTSKVSDSAIARCAVALAKQANGEFAAAWGGLGCRVVPVLRRAKPPAGAWWLVFVDNSDVAQALGYHDLTDDGLPIGKVAVVTSAQAGEEWTATASHELLEMLADPRINLTAFAQTSATAGKLYAYEVCDPVEAFSYEIDGVVVSDFVTPAWFDPFAGDDKDAVFSFLGKVSKPFTLAKGGYMSTFAVSGRAGWQQSFADKERVPAARRLPAVGTRRERRARGMGEWERSDPRDVDDLTVS